MGGQSKFMSAGGPEGGIQVVEQTFKALASFTGLKLRTLLVPNAPQDPRDLANNRALRKKALGFGRALMA